jgi:hypothetical protein
MNKIDLAHFMSADSPIQQRSHNFSLRRFSRAPNPWKHSLVRSLTTSPGTGQFLSAFLGLSQAERERLRRMILGLASAPPDARRLASAMNRRIGRSRQARYADCLRDIDRVIEYLHGAARLHAERASRKITRRA